MAPIYAAAVGITPQIIDDERLVHLQESLSRVVCNVPLHRTYATHEEVTEPLDIEQLVEILTPWQSWVFEEQVDLHEWIEALNKIDLCLSYYIQKFPSLLLIGPVQRTKSRGAVRAPAQLLSKPAESMEDVHGVPASVLKNIKILVKFLAGLLTNSGNKAIFNSVEELVDLLAAADDSVAAVALEALSCLATPPALHKQQAPEVQQHSSALHTSRTTSHKRLISLARGWGTRGSGLGLFTCVTTDDSEFGQGALPKEAGELHFAFFKPNALEEKKDDVEVEEVDDAFLVRVALHKKDIVDDSNMVTESMKSANESDDSGKQKRRRVAPATLGEQSIRSTAELFFACLEKSGGRDQIPADRLFPLLADIRLIRSFHCRATRTAAIERRLRALVAILHSHPSQEIMSGYFQAQPELCVELIDLLRPTVSSAAVSAAAQHTQADASHSTVKHDAISTLANSPHVPYEIRRLALEVLTALVARRDGTSGALTGVARHSNVLSELGVGKGQYLGLLPTLIRFSLSSLGSFTAGAPKDDAEPTTYPEQSAADAIAIDVGLAFVAATRPPPLPRIVQIQRALEFIDSVLTLTSAVVSAPSGTSALTDCGLIPALLTTVDMDHEEVLNASMTESSSEAEILRIRALLRYVTAQAVQIIEGAIVTHNNAATAFHDLQGVEILNGRLAKEILGLMASSSGAASSESKPEPMDLDPVEATPRDVDMSSSNGCGLQASQRMLLFSIVTCLTVVFHQESTSSSAATPSGAKQLRKPELTQAAISILENAEAYGGHLVSLIASLLCDVMNSDPHVVRHVHESGIANAFLGLLAGQKDNEPLLPPVPELIISLPNVLSALALTEDGANALKKANPFPALLRLFHHPKYTMPRSRCLLNEMAAIVGTGLDEIMRHVDSLKNLVCQAIADAMNSIALMGEALAVKEMEAGYDLSSNKLRRDLENERSCLMQYALNLGPILEQILHNEDHCEPFVAAGGLEALLRLSPCLMPTGMEFLSHISCLSCPSVSTLSHSNSENSMTAAFKCVALRYDSFKLIQIMETCANSHLDKLEKLQCEVRAAFSMSSQAGPSLDAAGILDGVPREPLYAIASHDLAPRYATIANYLRQVATVQWATGLVSTSIKAACQKSSESGNTWSAREKAWRTEVASGAFAELVARISQFHQSALYEVCRVRTEEGFEERDKQRLKGSPSGSLRFRLRIVCPEGAVVRDGTEIDSCASVGSMEMGEIADAFDRCVNSSGVLRYRTHRGWVSEQTRGHGREPITEVLRVWVSDDGAKNDISERGAKGRLEVGVPDLCCASASILARVQSSYTELFSSLSKCVSLGIRSLPLRAASFQEGTISSHVSSVMKLLTTWIVHGFNRKEIVSELVTGQAPATQSSVPCSSDGLAMYLGCLLSHVRACLFDVKRDRFSVNVPLLIVLSNTQSVDATTGLPSTFGIYDAIDFIFKRGLVDFERRATEGGPYESCVGKPPRQRISRTSASTIPAASSLLRRLASGQSITSSPLSSVLSRVKLSELSRLLGQEELPKALQQASTDDQTFSPEQFSRQLLCQVSDAGMDLWTDPRFLHVPAHVAHPIASLVADIVVGLEDSVKKASPSLRPGNRDGAGLFGSSSRGLISAFRGLVAGNRPDEPAPADEEEEFEPSEETITRLTEMGFSRDHAWFAVDSTRSNQVEVAMEHALSHPPSPRDIESRRNARQSRSREQPVEPPTSSRGDNEGTQPSQGEDLAEPQADTGSSADTMDIDASAQSEEKKDEDETISLAASCLEEWKGNATKVACNLLAGTARAPDSTIKQAALSDVVSGEGDGDVEGLTVVLCSFLIDFCQRYPDERNRVSDELLETLSSQLVESPESSEHTITGGRESSFAALCHATVLFTRALPRARVCVLKADIVNKIMGCIRAFLKASCDMETPHWPIWLSPALLLLDIMAQPVVAFSEEELKGVASTEMAHSADSVELKQVKEEHAKHASELSSLATTLVNSLRAEKSEGQVAEQGKSGEQGKVKDGTDNSSMESRPDVESAGDDAMFDSVPPYFPLLLSSSCESCVDICVELLGSQPSPPPGVVHGTLLLLMRLLRNPKLAAQCVKSGAAEKIFALPRRCRFTGHAGLVMLIMRRMLEDEGTLQAAMETEIRGTIMKLHGRRNGGSSSDKEKPSVSRRAFVQAMTPLLCRDPATFLTAVATTVHFEKGKSSSGSDAKVTLLSATERSKHMKLVADALNRKPSHVKSPQPRRSSVGKPKRSNSSPRSKTPTRSIKRGGKPKKEKSDGKDRNEEDTKGPAAMHVTTLLIKNVIQNSLAEQDIGSERSANADFGYENSFLWAANSLEVLADLVLAIPACATAIHKFRPSKGKERSVRNAALAHPQHALNGCTSPPKTFVSFLLHSLIAQDRWSSRNEHHMWDRQGGEDERSEEEKSKRRKSYRMTRVAQSSARLLVALVARPGEGRRRVIAELVFALSGGLMGFSSTSSLEVEKPVLRPSATELHALQAWGELCIGLAAPRSTGSNYDGSSMLSFEVVRIMLENGMVHALLVALHRVPLHHPMATSAVGALLLPFEILSRPNVAEAVKSIVDKEVQSKDDKGHSRSLKGAEVEHSRTPQTGGGQRHDSFADDHMLEEAFALTSNNQRMNEDHEIDGSFVHDEGQELLHEDDHQHDYVVAEEEDVEDADDDENAMEMEIDDIHDGEESDVDVSSSDESEESSSEEDEDSEESEDDIEEEDGDEDSILEESDGTPSGDEYEADDFAVDYRDDMLVDETEEADDGGTDSAEQEGWTRIETTGFGGMVLGGRRGMGQQMGSNITSRTRGFIDAAEAMIGTLLRTGEIQGDALADLEGLGIRIRDVPSIDATSRGDVAGGRFGVRNGITGSLQSREAVGTLPHVQQRAQPDVGYSVLGGGGRWSEISSMEYVFGGPSITAGSRNYDLVSPVTHDSDGDDGIPALSQMDGQLFPGGPASVAHSSTQHSLHPLLCGVDLPPVNALVSDLLPHGVRATRQGQMTTRRPGDWTSTPYPGGGHLVSTSNGNIIRTSRTQNAGPVGWTDDGLPFDSTVEEFSSAFERALGQTMALPAIRGHAGDGQNDTSDSGLQDSPSNSEPTEGEARDQDEEEAANHDTDAQPDPSPSGAQMAQDSEASTRDATDGDGVASSLATGLRLSPQRGGGNREESEHVGDTLMEEATGPDVEETSLSPGAPENGETGETVEGVEAEDTPPEDGDQADEAPQELTDGEPNANGLVCPPGMDPEVFNVLPLEMQQEVVEQARAATDLASQLDAGSSLDPEALAALPEDMRREVIEQEQRERRLQEQAPADPANAEEMDNASFVASLAPDLRREILMTADEAFLQSLPPDLIAEAQILRERAEANRNVFGEGRGARAIGGHGASEGGNPEVQRSTQSGSNRVDNDVGTAPTSRRRLRAGKIRVETDRDAVVYSPPGSSLELSPPVAKSDLKALLRVLYLLTPVRPNRLLQKVFQNLCTNATLRHILSSTFVQLLHDDNKGALAILGTLTSVYGGANDWRARMDAHYADSVNDFPPPFLIGAAPEVLDTDGLNPSITMIRRKQTNDTAASIAANLPMSARGSRHERYLPPVVATRIVDTLLHMCKASQRFSMDMLITGVLDGNEMEDTRPTGFERLLDLLEKPGYSKSSANLEQLLVLLESAVSPLSHLAKHGEEDGEVTQQDLEAASSAGKEWVEVPRIIVSQERLQLLCSILRMETCKDTSFTRVNTIARRLCRVEANRGYVLAELASVARALGADAIRDLKALGMRMASAAARKHENGSDTAGTKESPSSDPKNNLIAGSSASSSVAVSTSTSELKLLRVLQTLQALCLDASEEASSKKNEGIVYVSEELVHLLHAMDLDALWAELTACLKLVKVLEGVHIEEDAAKPSDEGDNEPDEQPDDGPGDSEGNAEGGKRLRNSAAGLLTRFLPATEAFFVANASSTRSQDKSSKDGDNAEPGLDEISVDNLVGGNRLVEFASANKVLLNALIRNNPGLLDKSLRALIQVPRCRLLLDFDVKRHWFKTQVRRLRQHASRRHGSLRLHIRRRHVFEDAYHQLRLRNADEMRGRLHITFRNEAGVDAGGLSREFFGILAKEIFDPNYALFTSTEDGSTFQPNPNSNINPDHLSYFRFVGRIVGKAVSDGYLLDAHFTRSLYKHMLGNKPTHHDMEAIDPDYYKNLKTILEYDLGDLGLELTFSIEDHSFGGNRLIDLIPDGRTVPVTEQNKEKYVSLVCQHRMTTAISSQIKAYLDGFYELVSRDLISVFTPRELELLISGLPDIDVHDLKQNTDYVGWKSTDKQIQWFWNVLFALSRNEKAAFMQFVTGSSKVPLAGFGELPGMRGVQKFSIHKASGSNGALMSAHTCFNSLDLPVYASEEELKEKLLYAINEGGGGFMLA